MDRKKAIEELRELHQPTFEELGIPEAHFVPKMAYTLRDHGLIIGFYDNEIRHGEDVYVEFVSRDMKSEDEKRTLYKFKGNPHYKDDYATTEPDKNGSVRFIIPVKQLEKIKEYDQNPFHIPDPANDLPLEGATIRDLAAILWKKPISNKEFINKLVRNHSK